jgi:hypothetical protein
VSTTGQRASAPQHRFDPHLANDDLGDVLLGRSLSARGVEIVVEPAAEAVHYKRHSLGQLLVNDFRRARALTRRIVPEPGSARRVLAEGVANASPSFLAGMVLAPVGVMALALTPLAPPLGFAGLAVLGAWGLANARFLAYAVRHHGPVTAVAFAGLLLLDHLAFAAGVVAGAKDLLAARSPTGPATSA